MEKPNYFETGKKVLEIIEKDGQISTYTVGPSMYPMLRQKRDVVVLESVKRPLKKTDVVLYPRPDGRFFLHRIMRIKDDFFIIRGDNNYFTERVKKDKIVAVLKEFYREGKHIDCVKNKKYRFYVFYICHSYYLRFVWVKGIKPILRKIKRKIIKTK